MIIIIKISSFIKFSLIIENIQLISDTLLWTTSHGRAKAGQPARICIQQLCANTGCDLEDLLEAMEDREGWSERVKDICADGTTWWCWWWLKMSSFITSSIYNIWMKVEYLCDLPMSKMLLPITSGWDASVVSVPLLCSQKKKKKKKKWAWF